MPSDWVWESRPTLTIWVYGSARGAAAGELRLQNLEHRGAVTVVDAVTVTWVKGTHRPRIGRVRSRPPHTPSRACVLGRFVELLTSQDRERGGPAMLASTLAGTGIDEAFLADAAQELAPDTSALLVLSTDVDLDLVRPVIERGRARGDVVLMHTYLTSNGLDVLRAVFGVQDGSDSAPADPQG